MCIPNIIILKDENYTSDTLLSIGLFEPIVNIAWMISKRANLKQVVCTYEYI